MHRWHRSRRGPRDRRALVAAGSGGQVESRSSELLRGGGEACGGGEHTRRASSGRVAHCAGRGRGGCGWRSGWHAARLCLEAGRARRHCLTAVGRAALGVDWHHMHRISLEYVQFLVLVIGSFRVRIVASLSSCWCAFSLVNPTKS